MTANKKNEILWKLDRSTGVKILQTAQEILGIVHVSNIIPSRTGSYTWVIKTPDEVAAFGSGSTVLDAMEEVEDAFQQWISKYPTLSDSLTPPVNPTHPSLEGVPAPKEDPVKKATSESVKYDPNLPIKSQLVRIDNAKRYMMFNKKIECGNYILSVQCGEGQYCSPREDIKDPTLYKLYEVAIMDQNREFCGKRIFPERFKYDDVLGYVEPWDIQQIANELLNLPADYKHPDTDRIAQDAEKEVWGDDDELPTETSEEKPKSSFFYYRQNNSGGSFSGPAKHVIVEAINADDANQRAEKKGLYFDGAGDCSCCGNRWSSVWSDEGETEPKIYDTPAKEYTIESDFDDNAVIFYMDGREDHWKIPVVKKNRE